MNRYVIVKMGDVEKSVEVDDSGNIRIWDGLQWSEVYDPFTVLDDDVREELIRFIQDADDGDTIEVRDDGVIRYKYP